jgi:GGDEF domain-containing protein
MENTADDVKSSKAKLFSDTLVPQAGNRKAFENFVATNPTGIHIRVNGNDFSKIDENFGHEMRADAVDVLGGIIHDCLESHVPKSKSKFFRVKNDEFHAFVPTMDHAAQVLRSIRSSLEALPPIYGIHPVTASIGIGADHKSAESAMRSAKQAKTDPNGKPLNPIHSFVPDHQGAY